MEEPSWNFEQDASVERGDETTASLRAYFDRMPDSKMLEYRNGWTEEQVVQWDGNFKDDGSLFLVCTERDVEVGEYRRVLEECVLYRARVQAGANTRR